LNEWLHIVDCCSYWNWLILFCLNEFYLLTIQPLTVSAIVLTYLLIWFCCRKSFICCRRWKCMSLLKIVSQIFQLNHY
jgi:hypothetical protein